MGMDPRSDTQRPTSTNGNLAGRFTGCDVLSQREPAWLAYHHRSSAMPDPHLKATPPFLGPMLFFGLATLMSFGLMAVRADAAATFDPETALRGVKFDPVLTDGNGQGEGHDNPGNGLRDLDEMALIAAVVNDPTVDGSVRGGVSHVEVRTVFDSTKAMVTSDIASLLERFPTAADMVTGYLMIGDENSITSIAHMTAMFGARLTSDYTPVRQMARFFAPDGDADGDGVSNRAEHAAAADSGTSYVDAALNPDIRDAGDPDMSATSARKKTVGILLYPDFEVLDVFGPVEMWSYVPDFKLVYVAERAGPVKSTQGAVLIAEFGFVDAPPIDILLVPGGVGTIAELDNAATIAYIRSVHANTELTTSVCTGSALLARAGALDGLKATSNKRFFSLAARQSDLVKWVVEARWVEDGKVFTSSGVSAGTDMALGVVARLYGLDTARQLANSVEYEWHDNAADDPFARFSDWPAPAPAASL